MTPLERELVTSAWPYVWAIIGAGAVALFAVAKWYVNGHTAKLDSIITTMQKFQQDLMRIEKEMLQDRADHQHRIDRVVGDSNARFTRVEAAYETQSGIVPLGRRSTDSRLVNWAYESDVRGDLNRDRT
jgi:uncharacterized membrane protein YdbT with pleckstrin-like domain